MIKRLIILFVAGLLIIQCYSQHSNKTTQPGNTSLNDSLLTAALLKHDTIHLVFSDSQVQKIITEFKTKNSDILSPGKIALLGAIIGALSAILAQLIIFILGVNKEKNKVLRELISEERSLSFLIIEFYKELAWLKVSYEFWYRLYEISNKDSQYQQFLQVRDKIPECKRNINSHMSTYFKTVTFFVSNIKGGTAIEDLLNTINNFTPLTTESSTFSEITDQYQLSEESEKESARLKSEYLKLKSVLDQNNKEMVKKLR
jgi:hypothetical protein